MVSVGTIVWLSSELMFFAALFATYFTLRSATPATEALWVQETAKLNGANPWTTARPTDYAIGRKAEPQF